MTPEREREIRNRVESDRKYTMELCQKGFFVQSVYPIEVFELLTEIDKLRGELKEELEDRSSIWFQYQEHLVYSQKLTEERDELKLVVSELNEVTQKCIASEHESIHSEKDVSTPAERSVEAAWERNR